MRVLLTAVLLAATQALAADPVAEKPKAEIGLAPLPADKSIRQTTIIA